MPPEGAQGGLRIYQSPKNKLSPNFGGGGGGGSQFPIFDAESKFAKIPDSHVGRGELVEINFQLLMLSQNLLKSQIPMSVGKG